MTWLYPEPDLDPGEEIERKIKAELIPKSGRHTTGYLYLTSRRLVYVPARGTPRDRAFVTRVARSRCVSVDQEAGKVSIGYGGGFLKRIRITLDDETYVTFGVRAVDDVVAGLRRALRV